MATTNPVQFIQQVRGEISKIAWPTRREVLITSLMVIVLTAIFALFFTVVDMGIRFGLQSVLTAFGS
ncbi:preprotein translocase subunit SecE [Mangrovicoccus algicola]|uniref:Protein translocase subunit SecE n=1 Tax=Mangrovicoccus algicola TaxID=2771008 RepID=A0A8J7CW60_9RHOB|nr:preprotein translocase subunit SecE [Mangrovicoccus algicola]MBE3637377.1 preprotein translocase subunit SecE [Mangrovicoccus algicola]